MLPIFDNYRKMLNDTCGLDLSQYNDNKLWIDRMIIRGFNLQGEEVKICRLKVTDDLEYTYKWYSDVPKNDELETWEESYKRLEPQIIDKEQESISVIKQAVEKHPNYQYILTTSMGKDSKLVQYLLDKCEVKYRAIFNNTTLDCADVYKEVKQHPEIEISMAKDKNGHNLSFYKLVKNIGLPRRTYRWCCDIFKEHNADKYVGETTDNCLWFMGMRNDESAKRANYDWVRLDNGWKNKTWISYLPIRKWNIKELWLYTLHNNITINTEYKKGYSRVGCAIACPFCTKRSWVLDKYWYPYNFNRWHKIIDEQFERNNQWCINNCTRKEYHLNWNGGIVREEPTDEVIKEFMEYKGLTDENVARQYFNKTCEDCGKKVYKKDEVAMNLKLFGREITKFKCRKCLMKDMNWTKEQWQEQVDKFKEQGCSLF